MKRIAEFRIVQNEKLSPSCSRLVLEAESAGTFLDILPGQFVNVAVPNSKNTFLRRPISVNTVSADGKKLSLVVRAAGEGTRHLIDMRIGDKLNIVLPLGNSFPLKDVAGKRILLIGGGVGIAPLQFYGERLVEERALPVFLAGARTESELIVARNFHSIATTHLVTDDGSCGMKCFVTGHPVLDEDFDMWVCCGPLPMMKAVARIAADKGVVCYVSLENVMACGIGACLCCVEKTVRGNLCVCKDGPIFNIKELTW